MVMEASRAEYLADDKFKSQLGCRESSSTSGAEPSSSGASECILQHIMATQFLYGVMWFDSRVVKK